MSIFIFPKRWSDKPPQGTQPNFGHPMLAGLKLFVPFSEGSGPVTYYGSQGGNNPSSGGGLGSGCDWENSPAGGLALHCNSTATVGAVDLANDVSASFPTSAMTIFLRRQKTDATLRASSAFGLVSGSGTNILNCHLPYSDGTGYWDFGGSSGSNRLTSASIPFAGVQNWVFTAGGKGMFMYLNGALLASSGTAVTRTNGNNIFDINSGAANGDDQWFYLFGMLNTEWDQPMAEWWSAEPYAMFEPAGPKQLRYFGAAASVIPSVLPHLGALTQGAPQINRRSARLVY